MIRGLIMFNYVTKEDLEEALDSHRPSRLYYDDPTTFYYPPIKKSIAVQMLAMLPKRVREQSNDIKQLQTLVNDLVSYLKLTHIPAHSKPEESCFEKKGVIKQ